MGELKNCIREGFWRGDVWDGLYEFFKFNLCCYNILEIKSILIISISLWLFKKKKLFQKTWKISQFPPIFLSPQSLSFTSSPNSQTKSRESLGKKEWASGRNRGKWRRVFGEFWRVYTNSSNLIYIVILFLKLKI